MSLAKTKRKVTRSVPLETVEARVAKSIAEVITNSVKELPKREQARRIKNFCDALAGFLRPAASISASSLSERASEEVSLRPSPSGSR